MFLTHLWKCALRQRTANGPRRRRPAPPRSFRPQLEELESRLVPSNTTVFTVTSPIDDFNTLTPPPPITTSGPNFTLRDAILGANATGGPAKIVFDLSTSGQLAKINIQAPLPTLVNDNTIIDGTSEPGWSGLPIVEINGTNPNRVQVQSEGLTINANGCTIKGLDIEGFAGNGVDVLGNSNVLTDDVIENNLGFGVVLAAGASNNIIGGTTGLIGGLTPVLSNNNIVDNSAGGVSISGTGTSGNILEGNFISFNLGDGVQIDRGASNNVIGGTSPGAGNQILDNGTRNQQNFPTGWGVELTFSAGTGNTIEENSISGNVRGGITLGGLPTTGNANPPASPEPNNAQNAPVLTSATSNGTTTTIKFTLDSAPNSTYRIEFFAADSTGQGKTFLGFATVTTDKKGQVTGTFTFTGTAAAFTATATDSAGDTSAFAVAVKDPVSNGHKQ